MEPFFLGYLLIPLGYTSALAALSASAERALERGYPEKAVKLLSWARRAPFLRTYRSMCEVNLITAAFALENFALVDEVWSSLEPRLESLKPYAGSALASYGATLVGRGRYNEAIEVLTHPVGQSSPEQPADEIALLCSAFCRANLASANINLGNFEQAQALLDGLVQDAQVHPVLSSLTVYLQAVLAYLEGQLEQARSQVTGLDISRLPLLYQTELYYHFAILLARCHDPAGAEYAVSRVQWETSSHRKLTRLRSLAQAEIASARHQEQKAVSYFQDLMALGHIDSLSYLRASALAKKLADEEASVRFLEGAVRLDPESHWAKIARARLTR